MPPAEFEPTISTGEKWQIYALDHAATETGIYSALKCYNYNSEHRHMYK